MAAAIKHAFEELAQLFQSTIDGGQAVPIPLPSSTDILDLRTQASVKPTRKRRR